MAFLVGQECLVQSCLFGNSLFWGTAFFMKTRLAVTIASGGHHGQQVVPLRPLHVRSAAVTTRATHNSMHISASPMSSEMIRS